MQIRPIRTDDDHAEALAAIEKLWSASPGSPEADRLEVLGTLVDAYERQRWPTPELDPVDALKAHMRMNELQQKDLGELLGSQSRASEILRRRRRLTLDHIRRVEAAWKLPAAYLVGNYELHVQNAPRRMAGRRPAPALKAAS